MTSHRIDLHCHSTRSDGADSPADVGRLARSSRLELFSLTDHDTTAGVVEAFAYADPTTRVLRGVEISCAWRDKNVHLLAYDRGGDWSGLQSLLQNMQVMRRDRLIAMAANLETMGIALDIADLLGEASRRSVGRPDLAKALVKAKKATSFKDAFVRYLYDRGPVDVPSHRVELAEVLRAGSAAGAAMSLAHPHLYGDCVASMMEDLVGQGLTGIEAYYRSYTHEESRQWEELAARYQLVCTGGSDRHTAIDGTLGVEISPQRFAALQTWLVG